MKNRKTEIAALVVILILQTAVYVLCGMNKSYLHMDEAYSYGLSSYDKTEIQYNGDFYNNWHNGSYYGDYLTVDSDEIGDYNPVFENQKNDVHPPLYYLLLRFFMGFSVDDFSFWCGLILNIIIHLFITVFMHLIPCRLLADQPYSKEKSAFISLLSALTLSSISSVMYIRMYALITLIILLTVYFHLNLRDKERLSPRCLIPIISTALVGSLTHYYYLFFLAAMFVMFAVRYYRAKQHRNLLMYIASFVLAAVVSLKIFPHSLDHLFSGYRGTGATSNLFNSAELSNRVFEFLAHFNKYGFHMMFLVILGIIITLQVCQRSAAVPHSGSRGIGFSTVFIPSAVYFIIVSISSPWVELRYILPVATLLFAVSMCYLFRLLHNVASGKTGRIITVVLAILLLISPVCLEIEPEFVYTYRADTVSRIENNASCPTLYVFNSNQNRFLDDILLFSKIDESYIAKDMDVTEENLKNIFADKDISKGVLIFINEDNDNDAILQTLVNALDLDAIEYVDRLNACDVYFLK